MRLLVPLGFEGFEWVVRRLNVDDSTICRQEDMICKDGIIVTQDARDVEAKASSIRW